jgi:hypothetical protein
LGNRLSKDIVCNTEGNKLIEFLKRNIFEIVNRKYGPDTRGKHAFINQVGKSVIDYDLVSKGLVGILVEFRMSSEVIFSHIPLLILMGHMLQRNVNMESIVENTAHKLVKYK